ncbi:S-layer homology domain-containing protein [Paenibacillus spongiae]|uniref:S-layer homology domain-containing protein n=1 Tax=Paenibacillus spongiae TaxID=2909671 RepID=A0ABY5SCF5_9BACL|nr:S-layer homology domain-containing protein [Paenibacillus spongiae]UVI29968.1 S-layer homology domain-containing protein [Paenibacillus spongiae]
MNPNQPITRAEVASLINKSFGYTETSSELSYKDIKQGQWFYNDISIAAKAGYMKGFDDKTFRPNATITRQEVAALVARLLELEPSEPDPAYADAADAPQWSKGLIGAVMKNGLMIGKDKQSFGLHAQTSRAEAVVILDRALAFKDRANATIVYDKPGEYGTDEMTAVNGSVRITKPGTKLRNMTITGDLTVDKSVGEGDVTLEGVTVKGKTSLLGGGPNSIVLIDSTLGTVIIFKENGVIRVVTQGSTTVQKFELRSGANLESAGTNPIGSVILSSLIPKGAEVRLSGAFQQIDALSNGISILLQSGSVRTFNFLPEAGRNAFKLEKGTQVDELTLGAGTDVTGEGGIASAIITAEGSNLQQNPDKLTLDNGISATVAGKKVTESSGGLPVGGIPSGGGGGGGGGGFPPNPGGVVVNLKGTVEWKGEQDEKAMLDLYNVEIKKYFTVTIKEGKFSIFLPDGIYEIYYSGSKQSMKLEDTITIKNGKPDPNNDFRITIPAANVKGTLVQQASTDGDRAERLFFYSADEGSVYSTTAVVSDGKFSLYMPVGEYKMNAYVTQDGTYILYDSPAFSVDDEKKQIEISIHLTTPGRGTIKYESSEPVSEVVILLQQGDKHYKIFSTEGTFKFHLPDGEYVVTGIRELRTQRYYNLFSTFNVINGQPEHPLELIVHADNVEGELKFPDGSKVNDGLVAVTNSVTSQTYWLQVMNNKFRAYLPDGMYTANIDSLIGFAVRNHNKNFTIKDGKLENGPIVIEIDALVTGSLYTASGEKSGEGVVEITRRTNDTDNSIAHLISVHEGEFGIRLPDGDYEITSYKDGQTEVEYPLTFKFTVDAAGNQPELMELELPDLNVNGTVTKDDELLPDGEVIFREEKTGKEYWTKVKNGTFQTYLTDGNYSAVSYSSSSREFVLPLLGSFSVKNGVTEPQFIELIVPAHNVTGTLVYEDNTPIHAVNLEIVNLLEGRTYFVPVNDGSFSMYLPNGNYSVMGYRDLTTDEATLLYASFVVENGSLKGELNLVAHRPNVTITAIYSDGLAVSGTLNITKVDSSENYVVSGNGTYSLYLPDGEYRLSGIYMPSVSGIFPTWNVIKVEGGVPTKDSLLDFVVPEPTVASVVWGNGGEPAAGEMSIIVYKDGSDHGFGLPVQNGVVKLLLEPGSYKIIGYHLKDQGFTLGLNVPFQIYENATEPLVITLPAQQQQP